MALHLEVLIEQARREGAFDNLPGRGKPLELDDDTGIHPEMRMANRILRNANVAPSEVTAMTALAALKAELREATDPAERNRLMREISRRDSAIRVLLERARRR
jgi:hypothetical protein